MKKRCECGVYMQVRKVESEPYLEYYDIQSVKRPVGHDFYATKCRRCGRNGVIHIKANITIEE